MSSPFPHLHSSFSACFASYQAGSLAAHHFLLDAVRCSNDALLHAARIFLHHSSPDSLLGLTCSASLSLALERLRDTEILSFQDSKLLIDIRELVDWCSLSGSRTPERDGIEEKASQLLSLLSRWAAATAAAPSEAMCGVSNHIKDGANCREEAASIASYDRQQTIHSPLRRPETAGSAVRSPVLAHSRLPHGWSASELARHCEPLFNTAELDLASAERDLASSDAAAVESRSSALARRRDLEFRIKAEIKRKQEVAKKKQLKKMQKLKKENEEESGEDESAVDSERDEEAERTIRFNDEGSLAEAEAELAALQIPDAPPAHRDSFSFCCIVCHSRLLRSKEIGRIRNNFVWSSAMKSSKALIKVQGQQWTARAEDEPVEALSADPFVRSLQAPLDSVSVHCSRCLSYVGRYYPALERFRLVFIHRLTGLNWLYFTAPTLDRQQLTKLMRPFTKPGDEEDEEENEAQEDEEENGEAKRKTAETVPPVVGLPFIYSSPLQASEYPFPRLGIRSGYPAPAARDAAEVLSGCGSIELFSAGRAFLQSQSDATTENDVESEALARSQMRLPMAGPLTSAAEPRADCLYSYSALLPQTPESQSFLLALSLSDRHYHAHRLLLHLSVRIRSFFSGFPVFPYQSSATSPVPMFLNFFLPRPDFTLSRGTARYLFHFLTQKDDAKLKRVKYSFHSFVQTLQKHSALAAHFCLGGWGGHRFTLVKIGPAAFRIFQSNGALERASDRFTCVEWLDATEQCKWARVLGWPELLDFLCKLELARLGKRQTWEELFCLGRPAGELYQQPQDAWQPSDVYYSVAKIQSKAYQYS